MQTMGQNYNQSTKMTIKGVLWHDTAGGNPTIKRYMQPSDDAKDKDYWLKLLGVNQYKNDWNHQKFAKGSEVGVNGFLGKLADGTVAFVQGLPWDLKPWGCGHGVKGSCNDGWIQFEICDDNYKNNKGTKAYFDACYKEACEITAYLCKKFNLNPKGTVSFNGVNVPVITCHKEAADLKVAYPHGDVIEWFKKYGKTMDMVRDDVAKLLASENIKPTPAPTPAPTPTPTTTFYKGDWVKIESGSTYYNSQLKVPNWVCNDTWYIASLNGDKALITVNKKKTNNINSFVSTKNLIKEGEGVTVAPTPTPTPTPTAPLTLQKGSLVKISSGATYYGMTKKVPDWAIKENWYVGNVNGNKVLLQQNEKKTNNINSHIHSKFLTVVK